ncbi:FAD binding domain-containing protein [Paraburkholderia fungorum]|uniref:FAD binding domain-containing protein n=1 Tax=Paraburkholderia fungorum TaxID=134537 RepID=UPI002093C59C|nr:FAD-dependent monooxygenase [Paraburkholderia fungorum]USU19150.1 FAD-dependent monooxygenase [Paraburkholderia fungorum]USU28854.1 FAD-dependent monooxygenase [Paraburkholderia fungorum]
MKIAIAGGSIAGLACALTLTCTGHEVHIYERSAAPLRGRGGGVVVLRQMLQFLDQHGHRTRAMLAVPTHRRRWIDSAGTVIRDDPELLPFSSWDTVYRSLCSMLPPGAVHYGHAVASVAEDAEGVEIRFDDDMAPVHADLLIAADGTASRLRAMLFPGSVASYAGYLAWRGVVEENAFGHADIAELTENMTLFQAPGELFMTFLIPALDGSLEPGRRRFNWLWYRNETDASAIEAFLTGRDGRRHHASVAPGELSAQSQSYLQRTALDGLPRTLSQLVLATGAPFLQAISDALSPSFAKGRIALVGDAACTLRPHTGSGTSKAAGDAVSLAQALSEPAEDVVQVLADWAAARRAAVEPLLLKGPQLAQSFGLGSA